MKNLDIKDKKILYQLYLNCRQTGNEIVKKVSLSREGVDYRIKQLEKKGFIKGYVTLIDTTRLGFNPCNVFITLQEVSREKMQGILQYFVNHPFIKWVVTCSGKWDLIVTLMARSRNHLDELLTGICTELGGNLKSYDILTTVKRFKDVDVIFLVPEAKEMYAEEERALEKVKLDGTDVGIIRILSKNARANIIDIAKQVNLTPEATSYRLKKLIKEKIIRNFRAIIDVTKLDFLWYMLLVEAPALTEKDETEIRGFCSSHKNIFYADKTIGKWQLRIELLAKDHEHFNNLLVDIRNNLSKVLHSYELLVLFKEFKQESFTEGMYKELKSKK